MVNYRVQNIEVLVKNLRSEGVIIVDKIEDYLYGKFVHILDNDGQKVELWKTIDQFFKDMGGESTK